MQHLSTPVVYEVDYSENIFNELQNVIHEEKEETYLLHYPTVYLLNDREKENYTVYVGETTDIRRRTLEHLNLDPATRDDWEKFAKSKTAKMFVIGHDHFNKSLTLDVENKLMQYMSSVPAVKQVNNRRLNQQNDYYTSDELEKIFSKIWRKLHQKNSILFPLESVIKDSAIFKASPFHKLTQEQLAAKDKILMKVEEALNRNKTGQLILVNGEAGSGKTVLMSSLFYELSQLGSKTGEDENPILKDTSQFLLVNHDQQLIVYQQIAEKLDLFNKSKTTVSKPTTFINNHAPEDKVDVVIVDEAHLLWTQGKQSYRGKNQLNDLLDRARVVVAVMDQNQILTTQQYLDPVQIAEMVHGAVESDNYIQLHDQLRINGSKEMLDWIHMFANRQEIVSLPKDDTYEIKIFPDAKKMYDALVAKSKNEEHGLSRILAMFDWPYVDKKHNEDEADGMWYVTAGNLKLPWNLQVAQNKKLKKANKGLAWAEQPQTIGEVGSTFTIQGFDLNYAAVIIGPSVKYRNGKVVFDKKASQNSKAKQHRGTDHGKIDVSDFLLKNELNVLLTRGVNGLYLYAVDEQLQNKLLEVQAKRNRGQ